MGRQNSVDGIMTVFTRCQNFDAVSLRRRYKCQEAPGLGLGTADALLANAWLLLFLCII